VVRRGASIGSGAIIMCGIEIGAGAMVGAGALVTRDVPPKVIVAGDPARPRASFDSRGARIVRNAGQVR
jgi:acetyltransferase-like isoleucine patch superfamily enzyme